MTFLKELRVGDTVWVCTGSGPKMADAERWRKAMISGVTESYVEIERGNRFDAKTGKEVESVRCLSPEHSRVFIDDDLEYWEAIDADLLLQSKIQTEWDKLGNAHLRKDIVECIDIVSELATLILSQRTPGS